MIKRMIALLLVILSYVIYSCAVTTVVVDVKDSSNDVDSTSVEPNILD